MTPEEIDRIFPWFTTEDSTEVPKGTDKCTPKFDDETKPGRPAKKGKDK